jgi:hypothetical protein
VIWHTRRLFISWIATFCWLNYVSTEFEEFLMIVSGSVWLLEERPVEVKNFVQLKMLSQTAVQWSMELPKCLCCSLRSRAAVPTDSVSVVYRTRRKMKIKKWTVHRFQNTRQVRKAETWWNPIAQTRPVQDLSSFVPELTLKRQNPLLSYYERERERESTQ